MEYYFAELDTNFVRDITVISRNGDEEQLISLNSSGVFRFHDRHSEAIKVLRLPKIKLQVFCDLVRDLGIRHKPENVIITTGAQEALDLIAKTFCDPGDIIITEGPTYLGALQAFSAYEPDIRTVPFDDQGMCMDLLEEELKKLEADLAHQQGFLRGVMAKLSNERFVQNAKPEIVALEQKKKADAEARIASLEEAIKALKK